MQPHHYIYIARKTLLIAALAVLSPFAAKAQSTEAQDSAAVRKAVSGAVDKWMASYSVAGYIPSSRMKADSTRLDEEAKEVLVYASESFCGQPLSGSAVRRIKQGIQAALPAPYGKWRLRVTDKRGRDLEQLVPNARRESGTDKSRMWGATDYKGEPWVANASLPYSVTEGLQGRHLFIWPSHGRYYNGTEWRWQRPRLYCTAEDLLTQSIVLPYLFPMLEKAGAVVCSPRERDVQTAEAVVDNDHPARQGDYTEQAPGDTQWETPAGVTGFAAPSALLNDSVQPFRSGTVRTISATSKQRRASTVTWTPRIPRRGRYAVYASYASLPKSVTDAEYTVYHLGGATTLKVNQRIGGGTWVYLGTYDFDEGQSKSGRVTLSNLSSSRGIVCADAVRFGGGVGQTERGAAGTSGLPRFLEAARYGAQWAGVPDSLFNTEQGADDYKDDLRVRSNMLNRLALGSAFVPDTLAESNAGENATVCGGVPFELALALHTDAGRRTNGAVYGSLAISTTQDGYGRTSYASGLSRLSSWDFAAELLDGLAADLRGTYCPGWTRRELWDRNYAETRMPAVPSAILEMLSHQSPTDMRYAHDPHFKFALARSVYKSILRFVSRQHGIKRYSVQPLPVRAFAARLSADGTSALLTWKPTRDDQESSAVPTGYIVYTKVDDGGFDNGQAAGAETAFTMPIQPGRRYSFRITAVNAGGESFPSETLAVYSAPASRRKVLMVNGFCRLSGPARIERGDSIGFDLDEDFGVPYLYTTAYCGRQTNFKTGGSGSEMEGKQFAGNTFDYPESHGEAIAAAGGYSYESVSREAFTAEGFSLTGVDAIDYIAGLERDVPHNLRPAKALPATVRRRIKTYLDGGGSLLLSGSYIGSDLRTDEERTFAEQTLKYRFAGTARNDSTGSVSGLNLSFPVYRTPSSAHYAAQAPDALLPAEGSGAFSAFVYGGGQGAGTAYKGPRYRTICIGFPFECICDAATRRTAMAALLRFLCE